MLGDSRLGPADLKQLFFERLAMKPRSLSSRMVLVFGILFTVVQVTVLVLVDRVGLKMARERNAQELQVGERVFVRLLDQNRQRLMQVADVLSKDFAFRKAVATGDAPTIASVLQNHGTRIQAGVIMLVSQNNELIADSLHQVGQRRPFSEPMLIRSAQRAGKSSALIDIDGVLYQVVVVPVLAPEPIAWVAVGFSIDHQFLDDLRALTSLHVSFVQPKDGGWTVLATTQPKQTIQASLLELSAGAPLPQSALQLGNFDTMLTRLTQDSTHAVDVVLQRSVSEGLEAFEGLKSLLALLTVASIVASVIGSIVVARWITQPLAVLSRFANRIRDGDYPDRVDLKRNDEVGALSASFNHMLEGIQARQAEISRLAYEDTVTSLPNRAMFNAKLMDAVAQYRRDRTHTAVLLLDLDRFKFINDTLGHHAGDLVLQAVATRLREALRETDTVARLGGDEFAILLTGSDPARACTVGRLVQAILEDPIDLDGQRIDVGCSIGVALCPNHGDDPWLLLRRADIAMYVAKREKSGMTLYDPSYDQHRAEHLSLLSDLRRAIAGNQLTLHYQPKVDLRRGRVIGVEALVRWLHPERGMVPPGEFVPFSEQTGMIQHITRWVIEHSIRQCGVWLADGLQLNVSVNVSSQNLLDRDLPQLFASVARRHKVPPGLITVEITESALMEDPERSQEVIRSLKAHGFGLSIDDYGTGYSSLAYIQRLRCDEIKVDRTFITDLAREAKDATIVRSTIELGHGLGMRVVAEGVECIELLEVLNQLGCDFVQGYAISRPLPPDALAQWLETCEWAPKQRRGPSGKSVELARAV
jgi:diguanylate cyclase (GGDEF)-like protein